MVTIQIDVSENLNKKINIYKAEKAHKNKGSAVIEILSERLIKDGK